MLKDNERERLVEVIGDYEIIETHCYPSSYCVRYKGQVDNATCNFARTVEECREKIEWRIKRASSSGRPSLLSKQTLILKQRTSGL